MRDGKVQSANMVRSFISSYQDLYLDESLLRVTINQSIASPGTIYYHPRILIFIVLRDNKVTGKSVLLWSYLAHKP